MQTHVRRWLPMVAVALLGEAVFVQSALADNLNVVIQRLDVSQFPSVRARVSVTSTNGTPVNGLDSRSVLVQEDGKPVDGLVVDSTLDGQEPVATALMFDISSSMASGNKLDQAKSAAMAYVDSLGPNDRTTVVSFASRVTVVQDYTADKAALKSAIDSLAARGETVLYDAIDQTARRQAAQAETRKPMILVTDSQDTTSVVPLGVAIATAVTAGTPLYSIGLGPEIDKDVLTQISQATGAQATFAADPNDLKSKFVSIDELVRRLYTLRYTSKLTPDTNQHGLAIQASAAGQQGTGLKSFTIPSSPGVAPQSASVAVAAESTSQPVPTAQTIQPVTAGPAPSLLPGIDTGVLVGLVLLALLVLACVWYLSSGRQGPVLAIATPAAAAPRTQVRGDRTEVVDPDAGAGGKTIVRPGRDRFLPLVRLAIVRDGRRSEFGPTRDTPITLGRTKDRVSVVIDDPLVSSEHARIRRDGAQFVVEDLKSKNGTQVNGEPIASGSARPLRTNDRIYIGDTVVTFVVDAADGR